jgi:hypothetical protein
VVSGQYAEIGGWLFFDCRVVSQVGDSSYWGGVVSGQYAEIGGWLFLGCRVVAAVGDSSYWPLTIGH